MSYCRYEKGKSDLYIIGTGDSTYECLGCRALPEVKVTYPIGSYEHKLIGLSPTKLSDLPPGFKDKKFLRPKRWRSNRPFHVMVPAIATMHSIGEVIAHVKKHLALKHKVPKYAIRRLEQEYKQEQKTKKSRG